MKQSMMPSHILQDGDSIVYRAGYGLVDDGTSSTETKVIQIVDSILAAQSAGINKHFDYRSQKVKQEKGPMYDRRKMQKNGTWQLIIGPSDSSKNFRYTVDPLYKSRRPKDKPPFYQFIRDYLLSEQNAIETPMGIETDDLISIQANEIQEKGGVVLINAEDKDYDQIFNIWKYWRRCELELDIGDTFTPKRPYYTGLGWFHLERTSSGSLNLMCTGDYRLLDQIIGGDTADSIPALVKGLGPMERYKILSALDIHLKETLLMVYNTDLIRDSHPKLKNITAAEFQKNYSLVKLLDECPIDTIMESF